MSRNKSIDLQSLSDQDVIKSFYLSQGLLFIIAVLGYLLFNSELPSIKQWLAAPPSTIIFLGFGSGLVLAGLELIIDRLVPKHWFDDGGINQRIFQAFSRPHIIIAMLVVALIEETLFRGIIQTEIGLVLASMLFGLIHVRYLRKPLMLVVALGMGFYLGWLYILTDSLIVPITTHFTIDVILGVVMKQTTDREKEREGM